MCPYGSKPGKVLVPRVQRDDVFSYSVMVSRLKKHRPVLPARAGVLGFQNGIPGSRPDYIFSTEGAKRRFASGAGPISGRT